LKKTKIQVKEMIIYGIVTCLSNLLATFAVSMILKMLVTPMEMGVLKIALTYIILFIGCFGISLAVLFVYLKNRVPAHYQPSDEKWLWLKNGIRLILPGEIVRCILGVCTLGSVNNTGLLSLVPTFVFEQTYMIQSGRHEAIRQELNFIFVDYLAYIGIYLIYLAVFLVAVLAIYRYLWNVGKRERDELIVRESKQRFY
jgi:hypothetical protein